MEKTKIKAPKQQIGTKIIQKSNKKIYTVTEVQRDEKDKVIRIILTDENGKKKPVAKNTIDCKYSLYNDDDNVNIDNREIEETSALINNIVEKSEDVSNTIDDTNKDVPVDVDAIYEDIIQNNVETDNTDKEIKDVSNTINDTIKESKNVSIDITDIDILDMIIDFDKTNKDEKASAIINKLLGENVKLKDRVSELENQLNTMKSIHRKGGRPKKEYDDNLAEQIIYLHRQGESYRNLAKRFGLSHSTIARTIKDNIDKY